MATNRLSFVTIGLGMFAIGAWFFANTVGHVQNRIDTWRDPFDRALYDRPGGSYQIAQSLFAQADGGLFGVGFGQALITQPGGGAILPAPQTDLIYAVIVNELGLVGACGLLLVYLLLVERGFKTAMLARDSFSKLLAAGLTAVFALQVFVIVGGVTKVIPLTGVTLPFVSYGGSSIVANFVLLALLLLVSDRARREARDVNAPVLRLYLLVIVLFAVLVGFTSRWTVFDAESLRDNELNRRALLQEQKIRRGAIRTQDGERAGALRAAAGRHLEPALPDERPLRPRRRLLVHDDRPRRHRALAQRRADRPDRRARPACSTPCSARTTAATRS